MGNSLRNDEEEKISAGFKVVDLPFVARELRMFGELEMKYLKEVIDGHTLSNYADRESMTRRFEEAFAEKVGAPKAMAKSSAMSALFEAVSVSGAGPGYEVICDPLVHFGGVSAVFFNAVPRFADIQADTYNMDPESLLANVTPLTRAVIVTHLWGQCADMDTIAAICREKKLFLIEDSAHAIGASWNGRHAGTFGDLGIFSFQEYKQLSTGDGGMTVTNDEKLFDQMRNVWSFGGWVPKFLYGNYRMNEMTAAVGLAQLQKIDGILDYYQKTLSILEESIKGCEWLKPRHCPKEARRSGYFWSCTWEGDKHGLSFDKFKKLNDELDVGLQFRFTVWPAQEFPFFRDSTAYRVHPDCPIRCPLYTAKSDYRYTGNLTPVCKEIMPRLVTVNLIGLSIKSAERIANRLQAAISKMET